MAVLGVENFGISQQVARLVMGVSGSGRSHPNPGASQVKVVEGPEGGGDGFHSDIEPRVHHVVIVHCNSLGPDGNLSKNGEMRVEKAAEFGVSVVEAQRNGDTPLGEILFAVAGGTRVIDGQEDTTHNDLHLEALESAVNSALEDREIQVSDGQLKFYQITGTTETLSTADTVSKFLHQQFMEIAGSEMDEVIVTNVTNHYHNFLGRFERIVAKTRDSAVLLFTRGATMQLSIDFRSLAAEADGVNTFGLKRWNLENAQGKEKTEAVIAGVISLMPEFLQRPAYRWIAKKRNKQAEKGSN